MTPIEEAAVTFIRHLPCDACGSRDNNSLYSDGHTHCFGCGAHVQGDSSHSPSPRVGRMALDLLPAGDIKALRSRKITEETCRHFGYQTSEYQGKSCQVAPYYDAEGRVVAQKLRFADKTFKLLGSLDTALPFGANVWQKQGKMIVVTEGEVDALAMSQIQGNKWPVVAISCGAGPQVQKYIAKHRDYFMGFEKVVIMFDADDPGRTAADVAASIIGRRAHIAELPMKDAAEMLHAGKTAELVDAMWKAKQYRPEGLVELSSLKTAVKMAPEAGLSYPWETLTQYLYGIRLHQLIGLGAGVGSGKTDLFTQIIAHLVTAHQQPAGVFYLETPVVETARRLAGKFAGKPFHVPDAGWTEADLDQAWEGLTKSTPVYLYDSFGNMEWEPIKEKIEYLHHAEGVQYFFIDHLTALAAWQDDERHALEVIMSDMGALVQRLPITIFFVSHLATPEGKPHEEGGRIYARHFKGSRAIIQWATDLIALERNQQAEDQAERTTTTVRILKERLTGRSNGKTFFAGYDPGTGLLYETGPPGERPQFKDETIPTTTGAPAKQSGPSDF